MNDKTLSRIISFIRSLKEENGMMTTGSTANAPGFSEKSPSEGPTAGISPVMKLDGRSKMMRRLPPPYRKALTSRKKK